MILTLHRRYPDGDHWEIDPSPLGQIKVETGKVHLEMKESPIEKQIRRVLGKPIAYMGCHFGEECEHTTLKIIEQGSEEYGKALVSELRRLGIEAKEMALAGV